MLKPRQMHLGMFLQGAGHHVAGWRYPGADSGSENLPHLVRQAVAAERAKFDMVFLADGLTSSEDGHPSQIARFEPLMVLTAFAMATSRIGLAATASTTYGEPFHLARAFASLDHISHGRAAWNAVTTSYASTGANFGDQASRARRSLRDLRGVHRRGPEAVGLVGGWRVSQGQGGRRLCGPVEAPCDRPQGPVLLGQRSAQHVAPAAGSSDHRAIRLVGARPAARGAHRRRGFHGASKSRKRAGVLSRAEGADGGVRPSAGATRDHAGLPAGARRHRAGGARQARACSTAGPTRARSSPCCPTGWDTTSRNTISTGRCRSCRPPTSCRAGRSCSPTRRGATTSRCASSPRWSRPAAATT